jgi:hypothetical protein
MKRASFALVGLLAISSYSVAQPPPSLAAARASSGCQKQVTNRCGRQPSASCLRDGVNRKQFSENCRTEIASLPRSAFFR